MCRQVVRAELIEGGQKRGDWLVNFPGLACVIAFSVTMSIPVTVNQVNVTHATLTHAAGE